MKKLIVVVLILLVCIACKTNTKTEKNYDDHTEVLAPEHITKDKNKIPSTAEAVAYANGLKNWSKVTEIKFTSNIDRDSIHYERSWSWKPKKDIVTLTTEKDTISYTRTAMDSITKKTDRSFINDKYWLLAPLNLVWDKQHYTSSLDVGEIAPVSGKEMQKLTIVYKDGGYTPGDAYDFYFEGDFIVKEWVFRKGNNPEPSLITTWEQYEDYNGIKISKMRHRKEESWKLYFTGIEVITD